MPERNPYEEARERVEEIKGFYQHALIYVVINAFLFVVNLITSGGHWWFYWPLLGWGIGVAAHAVTVFGSGGLWGKRWEERKIEEIMRDRGPDGSV